MFNYTKKELVLLALCLALLILLIYNLIVFPIINSFVNPYKNSENNVYSAIIPVYQQQFFYQNTNCIPTRFTHSTLNEKNTVNTNQNAENIIQKNQVNNNQQEAQNTTIKSQTSIIEENKNIKWRIQIPKINLDVHIKEGTTADVLLKSVGHFEETSKWQGNVGLAAHNRGYQCNFFAKIKNLQIGDEIIYTTTNGKKVYKITINKVIQDTDWSYLKNTNDNRITLITCEENRENYRRCIQAIEIANYTIKY